MKPKCEQIRERAFRDGLDSPAAAEWRAHCRSCPDCRTELFILDNLERQAAESRQHLGREEVAKLLETARRRERAAAPELRVGLGALRAACFLALLAVGVGLLPGERAERVRREVESWLGGGEVLAGRLSDAAPDGELRRDPVSAGPVVPAVLVPAASVQRDMLQLRRSLERRRQSLRRAARTGFRPVRPGGCLACLLPCDGRLLRRLAPALCFWAALLAVGVQGADAQDMPASGNRRIVENRQAAFRALEEKHPEVKSSALWDFHKRHSPDRIQEFERACKGDAAKSQALLLEMARHYLDLEELRQRSPEEYRRMLELEELESAARELGRRVTVLARSAATPGSVGHGTLLETRKALRIALEKCFERSQQNQLIELNRLEAEVRDLRALLEQRQGARELILQQRFLELSGTQWEPGGR